MARYLTILILAFLTASAGLLSLNFRVDPYGIWHPDEHPLSASLFGAANYSRIVKNHWLRHYDADLVLLGNSHAASSFRQDEVQKRLGAKAPFSLAMQGMSLLEMKDYVRHAYFTTGARRYILVLDLLNFNDVGADIEAQQATRLAVDSSITSKYFYLSDFARTTFSWQAMNRSLMILAQGYPDTHLRSGFLNTDDCGASGSSQRFLVTSAQRRAQAFASNSYLGDDLLQELDELLGFMRDQDLHATILVPPFNIRYYFALEVTGQWKQHKKMLSSMTASVAKLGAGENVEIIDFTSFGRYTTQFRENNDEPFRYWLDSDHFTCELADIILGRVAQLSQFQHTEIQHNGTARAGRGFGRKVTEATVAAHLRYLEKSSARWKDKHPRASKAILNELELR
jgi:hypothetical protein